MKATLFVLVAFAFCDAGTATTHAQTQGKKNTVEAGAETPAVFCDSQRALEVVGQQASEAKLLEATPARVSILARTADLLWPFDEVRARALFAEAFDDASRHFRDKGYETRTEQSRQDSKVSGLSVLLPDQRFVVLRAVARRDAVWARKLTEAIAEEARREADEDKSPKGVTPNRSVGGDILLMAESLLETDVQAALTLARSSFSGPLPWNIAQFLYRVAERDRAAADTLFLEALRAYAGRHLGAMLYLSPYPFGFNFTIANPAGPSGFSRPPAGFAASAELQRQYLAAFLMTAEWKLRALAEQPAAPDEERSFMTEAGRVYTALLALESSMGAGLDPATHARLSAATAQAMSLVPAQMRARAVSESQREFVTGQSQRGADSFERAIEQAAQHRDPERREMFTAMAISNAPEAVGLARLEEALRSIEDAETRRQLSTWVYFTHSQKAAKEGALDEATRLAERVDALDERALLFLEIADEGIKRFGDKQRAAELLETVARAALKSPDTVSRARAQLGVAYLYARFDYQRASEVMSEAVKTINRLDAPDFSQASLTRKIEGKSFSTFKSNPVPGFNLENAFAELSELDYEGTLTLAHDLQDRHLRATATLALSAKCLEESQKQKQKPAPKKVVKPSDKRQS